MFSTTLQKSDIAIDCGANVGTVTRHLCSSGALVYAFEPNPYAFSVLQSRFANLPNVHCISKGVGDSNGFYKLYLHENSDEDEVHWSTGSSLLSFKGNVLPDKYVEVEVIDLCEFIEKLNQRVKVLKMDVEGIECRILTKMIKTGIIYVVDQVFVETHDHKVPQLKAETDAVRELLITRGIRNVSLNWK